MNVHAVLIPVLADLYAVQIDWVQEVVAEPRVTQLPTAPSPVVGLFNLRGEIIPLLDTAALLGVGRIERATFAAVLGTPAGQAGLAGTACPQHVTLDTPIGPSELPGTRGMFWVERGAAVLLDLPAVFAGLA